MARVIGVHGIRQQFKGEETLRVKWLPALRDGLHRVGVGFPYDEDLVCAFYGDLFRTKGAKAIDDPPYDARDVNGEWELDLLTAWWHEAARVEPQVPGPETTATKSRTPTIVQRALNALSQSRFFAGVSERALIGDLKQVGSYLNEDARRNEIQQRVAQKVMADTRIMIGHSLGSIVAYEALCTHPEWPIRTFITLGSPLAIRNLIFDRLHPPPVAGVGIWPGNVTQWTNIADSGDVVALVKELHTVFGARVQDQRIYNGANAHDIEPYLTAEETGRAIATGLTD
jgi:hypothetical protein